MWCTPVPCRHRPLACSQRSPRTTTENAPNQTWLQHHQQLRNTLLYILPSCRKQSDHYDRDFVLQGQNGASQPCRLFSWRFGYKAPTKRITNTNTIQKSESAPRIRRRHTGRVYTKHTTKCAWRCEYCVADHPSVGEYILAAPQTIAREPQHPLSESGDNIRYEIISILNERHFHLQHVNPKSVGVHF